jgi:hypothetical protein
MTDAMKNYTPPDDGFDDTSDGDLFPRVIQGTLVRFGNDGAWKDSDDEKIPEGLELVVNSIGRVVQKWINQSPVETTFLQPSEKCPDIEALNAACPKSEWGEDFNGNPRGPWQVQQVVYLVNLETMQKFTFPTSTTGGGIAIGELKDAVQLMRRYRGAGVYPVVRLTSRHMHTRFGGRERPFFQILRWISFDQSGGPALPPTTPGSLPSPGAAAQAPLEPKAETQANPKSMGKANPKTDKSGARVVEEPTLREELNDSIDF